MTGIKGLLFYCIYIHLKFSTASLLAPDFLSELEGSADRFCTAPAFWARCTPEIFRTSGQCDQRFSQHRAAFFAQPNEFAERLMMP